MRNDTGVLVVGVDDSPGMPDTVRWAAADAARRHRRLRLVHATDELSVDHPDGWSTSEDLRAVLRMRGERLLHAARDAAWEAAPGVDVEVELSHDGPAAALLDPARSAALLVLGARELRPLGRILGGSLSVTLAAHAGCPVALVRPHVAEETPPSDGPVVLGVDASPASEEAVAFAFDEASWRNAALIAVHAWDDSFLVKIFEETRWTLDESAIETRETEVLAERLAGWQEKYPDVPVQRVITRGRPATALLDLADRAQLLVVGSRGR
ncbi:universal stress protein, partial [Amycolatopsis pithecellobii]